jgi:hypothetical protein
MAYALYYATTAAPEEIDREALQRLVPVHFTTAQDALHAAALVLRGGQFVWLIEGPEDLVLGPEEIEARCRPTLDLFRKLGP